MIQEQPDETKGIFGASELNREAMPPSRISQENGCHSDFDSAQTALF
jgi:hypothetical protein